MSPYRILLVEDEIDFLETIANRLKRRQFEVCGVTTGAEALSQIRNAPFDLVLLDVKLPDGMDGIAVLQQIKQIRPNLPVIMLTGHASQETSAEGMLLGADDYLLKPVRFEELLVKMAAALEKTKD